MLNLLSQDILLELKGTNGTIEIPYYSHPRCVEARMCGYENAEDIIKTKVFSR